MDGRRPAQRPGALGACARHAAGVRGVLSPPRPRGARLFRRLVFDVETAFDLTAETFAAALRAVPRYEPRPEPARAWLFGIARNTLLEALRRGQVEDRARRALAMQPIALDEDDVATLELLTETSALEAIAELPDEHREAVIARHVDGESYAAIAQRLACSESVLRQRVSRGLRALRAGSRRAADGARGSVRAARPRARGRRRAAATDARRGGQPSACPPEFHTGTKLRGPHGSLIRCTAPERTVDFGLLGPNARSFIYRSGGRDRTATPLGGVGAYLVVQKRIKPVMREFGFHHRDPKLNSTARPSRISR